MSALLWIVAVFLLIVSIIDYKFRAIPSIFLTGMLFVVAFVCIFPNPLALSLGILGLIFAFLLYESNFIGGIADVKIIVLISLMVASYYWLLALVILVLVYGITWKSIVKIRLNKEKEFAFIPVLFFVYITLIILGGIK